MVILLELTQKRVYQKGYSFVKGKSRSKRFASPPLEEPPKPRCAKVCAEVRQKRISALEEEITNLEKQLHFKEKRRQQAESTRNYKLCEEITEEIRFVSHQKRDLSEELCKFKEKERKAKWYLKTKNRETRQSRSKSVSDDSDLPLSSPASIASISVITDSIEVDSDRDVDQGSSDSVFPPGLPTVN